MMRVWLIELLNQDQTSRNPPWYVSGNGTGRICAYQDKKDAECLAADINTRTGFVIAKVRSFDLCPAGTL